MWIKNFQKEKLDKTQFNAYIKDILHVYFHSTLKSPQELFVYAPIYNRHALQFKKNSILKNQC